MILSPENQKVTVILEKDKKMFEFFYPKSKYLRSDNDIYMKMVILKPGVVKVFLK